MGPSLLPVTRPPPPPAALTAPPAPWRAAPARRPGNSSTTTLARRRLRTQCRMGVKTPMATRREVGGGLYSVVPYPACTDTSSSVQVGLGQLQFLVNFLNLWWPLLSSIQMLAWFSCGGRWLPACAAAAWCVVDPGSCGASQSPAGTLPGTNQTFDYCSEGQEPPQPPQPPPGEPEALRKQHQPPYKPWLTQWLIMGQCPKPGL